MTFELAHENKSWFLFLILDSFFNFYFFSNLSSSLSVEDLGLGAIDRTSSCQGRRPSGQIQVSKTVAGANPPSIPGLLKARAGGSRDGVVILDSR